MNPDLDVCGAKGEGGPYIVAADPNAAQSWEIIPSQTYTGYFYIQARISGLSIIPTRIRYGASREHFHRYCLSFPGIRQPLFRSTRHSSGTNG